MLKCYEAFNFKGAVFMILDHMNGCITDLLESDTKYPENVCKYILFETLKGLNFLHERHIVHRDIKSDNILFDKDARIMLADFGCAAQLTKQLSARSTFRGTLHWLSPEMIRTLTDS
jgi:serine/threonine-protein kinase CLA4